ncbi:Uncharacterized protein TCM_017639 [Theobroma cacao]|uniref:Uncharacterized protein n=1 Tax=Theobroma cacao TaxID=3641 RepID=A0A061EDX9_THECC|nr:Uncharacterized protein TCM_017639 [Theobroma cacao]
MLATNHSLSLPKQENIYRKLTKKTCTCKNKGKREVEMRYTKDFEFGLLLGSTKVKIVYCGSVPEEITSYQKVAIARYASELIVL